MRVRGDNAPSNAFSLEEQPNKPGVALVRFYENAEPFEEKRGELTVSGWQYDEYHLELNMYDGLSEDILGPHRARHPRQLCRLSGASQAA